jgi:uncharacterized protein (DUF1778 family)
MPASAVQINAPVSPSTKRELDQYTRQTGTKQGFVVDQALQHHLQALRELPTDVIVHARLVVTAESMKRVADSLDATPTQALRDLMRGR